jgi:predicted DCC family thiol-disulfide oxidoreductase YuxK
MNDQTIIFFDGVCHLCNGFINFLVRVDRRRVLKYAPLQGTTAAQYLSAQDRASLETIIVLNDGKTYYRSRAILKVFSIMGGIFRVTSLLKIFPASWLDFFYRKVALNRYSWFGKREFCRLPTAAEREYLLP